MSALAAGHLVRAHMAHNRKPASSEDVLLKGSLYGSEDVVNAKK
jgi:hypothetical protein